jgi:hypothetical protein
VDGRDRLTRLAAMPGTNKIIPLLALVAAVAALSGCGSGGDINGQIPATNADQMNSALNTVRTAVASNDCATANSGADGFVAAVNELPATAGADLKQALQDAGANLRALVSEQCPPTGATGRTGPQTTESSSTEPSTSTTSSSTTTSSTTTSSTSSTETSPQGNGNPGGNGGGAGAGNGNGGGQGGSGDGGTGGTGGTGG